jgi:hypothetical protein
MQPALMSLIRIPYTDLAVIDHGCFVISESLQFSQACHGTLASWERNAILPDPLRCLLARTTDASSVLPALTTQTIRLFTLSHSTEHGPYVAGCPGQRPSEDDWSPA